MSGRWKKTIWALLIIQMCLLHVYFLYFLYDKGFCLAALGVSVVSVLMVLIFFIHYRRFRVQCISGIYPLEEEGIRHQYEEARIRAGITRSGRKLIYASPKVATPFVLGFYKPVILLPEWAKEEEMLAMLLTHECVHIRHKDTWYKLSVKPEMLTGEAVKDLDVAVLQEHLLQPVLGILDPKSDGRIDFVGGIRGLKELERRVQTDCKVAFAMYPTDIHELFAVSDAGKLMPPKSTWFEPKLRSGLLIHSLEE